MADTAHKNSRLLGAFTWPSIVLLMCLSLSVIPHAKADASTRQDAITEALNKAGGDSKVIGVREEVNADGVPVFAVKVLSNGRIRVFRIPKSTS